MATLPSPPTAEAVELQKSSPLPDRLVHQLAGGDESVARRFVPVQDPAFDALIYRLASDLRAKFGEGR